MKFVVLQQDEPSHLNFAQILRQDLQLASSISLRLSVKIRTCHLNVVQILCQSKLESASSVSFRFSFKICDFNVLQILRQNLNPLPQRRLDFPLQLYLTISETVVLHQDEICHLTVAQILRRDGSSFLNLAQILSQDSNLPAKSMSLNSSVQLTLNHSRTPQLVLL